MVNKVYLSIAGFFLVALMVIFAKNANATSYCIDNKTLLTNETIEGNVITQNEDCPNGCSSTFNICQPSEFVIYIIFFGALVVILFVINWLRRTWLR